MDLETRILREINQTEGEYPLREIQSTSNLQGKRDGRTQGSRLCESGKGSEGGEEKHMKCNGYRCQSPKMSVIACITNAY